MNPHPLKKVLILSGPTGVGKTAIAVLLSSLLDGEIISCDSVQIYKELVIGSNKELGLPVPQHLIDIVSWKEKNFTNADFHSLCLGKIEEITSRGKIPLLVGGTGFYTKWIVQGRPSCPPPSKEILAVVDQMTDNCDWEEAINLLKAVDPEYAASLYKNDRYRLKRAIANHLQTNQPMSSFKPTKEDMKYDFRCFYLSKDRPTLSLSIDCRCEKMISNGLLREVGELWLQGLKKDYSAGRAIGYSETIDFIESLWVKYSSITADEQDEFFKTKEVLAKFRNYVDLFKASSRQYSRRQDSWHKDSEFKWIDGSVLKSKFDSVEMDPLIATSTYITRAFNLSRFEWDTSAEFEEIHKESLSLRWSDTIRKSMKTYQAIAKENLKSIFTCDDTCHATMLDQLKSVFNKKHTN
ncbi:hypothetical protein MDAP_002010 [Mitosporidium daphniae]|uniref:tRNA dimethylallyltransferase n=1 Tax=Mitosporidium daphniae TaxID=1485682 RepID=A0A098VLY8_9MICR|nr:tRNA dimethylallyltransferase [Mitosporidium daphniae]KGG50088.1 tRNA dimethylallyltransferase [Mitosporidium daphniae]|eukprot:XP_013236515.1 tRNA dimethylallyltransferase [Mitosporidium daphniae]